MPSNIERFGQTLHGQMKHVGNAESSEAAELGRSKSNGDLLPDDSPGPIPKGEYMICKGLGKAPIGRVLINWCGSEPVIVDAVEDAK